MDILLRTDNITKTYRSRSGGVEALRGVSLELERGIFCSIIGRSGCGKSTLLNLLSGMDRPTSGSVTVDGRQISKLSSKQIAVFRRRSMGFVFQHFNLLDDYKVLQNIIMPLTLDRKKPDSEYLDDIVELLGLKDKLRRYPNELSGGEQQRVAIARSIIAKPKLIFADEPTGNLDRKTGSETMELLRGCASRSGGTLVVVTHDPDIAAMADRVIHLDDGKIVDG